MPDRQCQRCGSTEEVYEEYCEVCYAQFRCTCCSGDAERCGCAFMQTGKLYYDCTVHQRVVRIVADSAPVEQAPRYFRL